MDTKIGGVAPSKISQINISPNLMEIKYSFQYATDTFSKSTLRFRNDTTQKLVAEMVAGQKSPHYYHKLLYEMFSLDIDLDKSELKKFLFVKPGFQHEYESRPAVDKHIVEALKLIYFDDYPV